MANIPSDTDIAVFRGGFTLPGPEFSTTSITLDASSQPSDVTKSFIKYSTNLPFAGNVCGTNGNTNSSKLSNIMTLLDASTIQVERDSSSLQTGRETQFRYEIWEYTGEAGGPNEFIVHGQTEVSITGTTLSAADTSHTYTSSGDVVLVHNGSVIELTTQGSGYMYKNHYMTQVTPNGFTVRRVDDISNHPLKTVTSVIEFTGSNWRVEQHMHNFSSGVAPGTNEDILLDTDTYISWDRAFVLGNYIAGGGEGAIADGGFRCWPKNNTGDISAAAIELNSGADDHEAGDYSAAIYVIENPYIRVEHYYTSRFGGGSDYDYDTLVAADFRLDVPLVKPVDPASTSLIITAHANGTGTAVPRNILQGYLIDGETAQIEQGYNGQTAYFALQVVSFAKMIPEASVF